MFTLIHLTFLNNWHVTAEAVLEAVVGGCPGNARTVEIFVFTYCLDFVLGWGS